MLRSSSWLVAVRLLLLLVPMALLLGSVHVHCQENGQEEAPTSSTTTSFTSTSSIVSMRVDPSSIMGSTISVSTNDAKSNTSVKARTILIKPQLLDGRGVNAPLYSEKGGASDISGTLVVENITGFKFDDGASGRWKPAPASNDTEDNANYGVGVQNDEIAAYYWQYMTFRTSSLSKDYVENTIDKIAGPSIIRRVTAEEMEILIPFDFDFYATKDITIDIEFEMKLIMVELQDRRGKSDHYMASLMPRKQLVVSSSGGGNGENSNSSTSTTSSSSSSSSQNGGVVATLEVQFDGDSVNFLPGSVATAAYYAAFAGSVLGMAANGGVGSAFMGSQFSRINTLLSQASCRFDADSLSNVPPRAVYPFQDPVEVSTEDDEALKPSIGIVLLNSAMLIVFGIALLFAANILGFCIAPNPQEHLQTFLLTKGVNPRLLQIQREGIDFVRDGTTAQQPLLRVQTFGEDDHCVEGQDVKKTSAEMYEMIVKDNRAVEVAQRSWRHRLGCLRCPQLFIGLSFLYVPTILRAAFTVFFHSTHGGPAVIAAFAVLAVWVGFFAWVSVIAVLKNGARWVPWVADDIEGEATDRLKSVPLQGDGYWINNGKAAAIFENNAIAHKGLSETRAETEKKLRHLWEDDQQDLLHSNEITAAGGAPFGATTGSPMDEEHATKTLLSSARRRRQHALGSTFQPFLDNEDVTNGDGGDEDGSSGGGGMKMYPLGRQSESKASSKGKDDSESEEMRLFAMQERKRAAIVALKADVAVHNGNVCFLERFGLLIAPFVPERRWFLVAELGLVFVMAVAEAWRPTNGNCTTTSLSLLVCLMVYLCGTFLSRPYRTFSLLLTNSLITLIQVAATCLIYLGHGIFGKGGTTSTYDPQQRKTMFEIAAMLLATCSILLPVKALFDHLTPWIVSRMVIITSPEYDPRTAIEKYYDANAKPTVDQMRLARDAQRGDQIGAWVHGSRLQMADGSPAAPIQEHQQLQHQHPYGTDANPLTLDPHQQHQHYHLQAGGAPFGRPTSSDVSGSNIPHVSASIVAAGLAAAAGDDTQEHPTTHQPAPAVPPVATSPHIGDASHPLASLRHNPQTQYQHGAAVRPSSSLGAGGGGSRSPSFLRSSAVSSRPGHGVLPPREHNRRPTTTTATTAASDEDSILRGPTNGTSQRQRGDDEAGRRKDTTNNLGNKSKRKKSAPQPPYFKKHWSNDDNNIPGGGTPKGDSHWDWHEVDLQRRREEDLAEAEAAANAEKILRKHRRAMETDFQRDRRHRGSTNNRHRRWDAQFADLKYMDDRIDTSGPPREFYDDRHLRGVPRPREYYGDSDDNYSCSSGGDNGRPRRQRGKGKNISRERRPATSTNPSKMMMNKRELKEAALHQKYRQQYEAYMEVQEKLAVL